jgi:hypothetical protein
MASFRATRFGHELMASCNDAMGALQPEIREAIERYVRNVGTVSHVPPIRP